MYYSIFDILMTTLFDFEITGSVVDVGKLLTQLKRSETARSDTESQLKSACKSVQELKDASEKHASVKDKLQVSFDCVILRYEIDTLFLQLKLIYSENATKVCEISTVDLSYVVPVKSMMEISQNFVAFSEYMNFNHTYIIFKLP